MQNEYDETIYYGVAYQDADGIIQYEISEDYMALYQFSEQCIWRNLYPTPIVSMKAEEMISSLDTVTNMQIRLDALYNSWYIFAVNLLGSFPTEDVVYEILEEDLQKTQECPTIESLQLFASLVYTAVKSKILTTQKGLEMLQWVENEKSKILKEMQDNNQEQITLYCVVYESEDAELCHYISDNQESVCREKAKHDGYAMFTTPIFQKTYNVEKQIDLLQLKTIFRKECIPLFHTGYLQELKLLKYFPSSVSEYEFDTMCNTVKDRCSRDAYEAFLTYGYRWNVKQY